MALGALVATTTAASFTSERQRVVTALRSGAELAAATLSGEEDETLDFLGPIAAQPAVRALDPSQCEVAFSGLASLIGSFGHLHLLGGAGEEICSLRPLDEGGHHPAVDWSAVLPADGRPASGGPAADPLTGKMSRVLTVPVEGAGGRTGYLVAVLYLSEGASRSTFPPASPRAPRSSS